MRILWLCNIMLPMIAKNLHMEVNNKEGWLSGLATTVLKRSKETEIELAVAFPLAAEIEDCAGIEKKIYDGSVIYKGLAETEYGKLHWYGFREDVVNPHLYDESLELQMHYITADYQPDVVHCFGTEYPHTLAMCRAFPYKNRILIGIQGLCKVYADTYFADLPKSVMNRMTLRDFLKKDSLKKQQKKFVLRGEMEYEAIRLAGNVTGRTAWDKHYTALWNPSAQYYEMNETLRPDFYSEKWEEVNCEPHSIFLSQGDYPIKGLHYMLLALPKIQKAFPDVQVYVAGNSIVGDGSLYKRLKISAYGGFLRKLLQEKHLGNRVHFLGRLNAEEMKQRYLKSHLFVCCSTIENSPNSLGEAMLLGVPCVSADVGGISSIFTGGEDGILYDGYGKTAAEENADNLSRAVIKMWSDADARRGYTTHAKAHAAVTHDPERNYQKLLEIYADIAGKEQKKAPFVFVSNYINHHQIPFCNAMYERLGKEFVFIQTSPMEEERVRMGWDEKALPPYVKKFYEEPEACEQLIDAASMVLFGGVDDESYIEKRLQSGKPVIRYSERIYKAGQWKAISPKGLLRKYHDHTRYRKKPIYMLCSGAYVPSDFQIVHAYPDKMLKWGYFPETKSYDVDKLMQEKEPKTILWAARFLDWKHPEVALRCAKHLKDKGISFHMNIVGGGEMQDMVNRLVKEYELEDVVSLLGFKTPAEVRSLMEKSAIYLTTSDRKEGWGAVINEAMNSGCCVVASHMMGAAPYLICHGENGFIYPDGKEEQLFAYVENMLQHPGEREQIGRCAMERIQTLWNAEQAADALLAFCDKQEIAGEGPCSVAPVISERNMLWNILHRNL